MEQQHGPTEDLFVRLRGDVALQDLYRKQWRKIKDSKTEGKVKNMYNFRLVSLDLDHLHEIAKSVFDEQKTAFKVNAAYGFVLKNNETGQLRYHYTSSNTQLLTGPMLVQNRTDFTTFLSELLKRDPLHYARAQRPNSKWVVDLITNVSFYVYKIPDHP